MHSEQWIQMILETVGLTYLDQIWGKRSVAQVHIVTFGAPESWADKHSKP